MIKFLYEVAVVITQIEIALLLLLISFIGFVAILAVFKAVFQGIKINKKVKEEKNYKDE